jgi:3-methyladenine DNA glycosylase AlkD
MIDVFGELAQIKVLLNAATSPENALKKARFYKTSKSDYAENAKFIGLSTPDLKIIAKNFKTLPLGNIKLLLQSEIHEERALALFILVSQYKSGDTHQSAKIYDFYLQNLEYINNWDLVDSSCPYIMGDHLLHKDKKILFKLVRSSNIWERRIAIVSTWMFIRNNEFESTIKLCEILLGDSHDLIHKACGWMLREIYKRDPNILIKFLEKYAQTMPRTVLRYAIERFPHDVRKFYLSQKSKRVK